MKKNSLFSLASPRSIYSEIFSRISASKQGLKTVEKSIQLSKHRPLINQKYRTYLFKIVCFIIAIPFLSAPSLANKSINNKDTRLLHGLQVGTFQNRADAKGLITKLQQLNFETRIISLNDGYTIAVGAFSSQTNLERAVNRLAKAKLDDKVRVVEIITKRSQKKSPVKTKKNRTTLTSANTSLMKEEYVPKKEYEKLEQEVELLKAQMQSLLNQQSSSKTKIAEASPVEPSPSNEPETEQQGLAVDQGSREEEAEDMKRQLDTFLRRQKVLFKKGELEVEFGLSYAQSSDRAACFNPNSGSEFCQKDRNLALSNSLFTRSVDTNLSVSYGILDDLAFSLSFPYSYSELESDSAPFTVNGQRVVNHNNHIGLGDISGSLRYTALHESESSPSIALNINAKSPSGDEKRRLGTGTWNIGAGVSLTKTIDPVVFFGSLGYTSRLSVGEVDLGDQISYTLGGGFSLNNRVSVAVALTGSALLRDEINGREVPGSSQDISSLQFSSTIKLTKALFVEPFVAFGLTEGASDFIFGINMPYRFEDKYPLPFF